MKLSSSIKKEIKKKYPIAYKSNQAVKNDVWSKVYGLRFRSILFIYLLQIAIVITYTYFFDFDLLKILNVNFEDNIKSFTTGIITLVSMNLFVTNLLFTHLRDERDNIQSIIDRKVNFKFITYLGFSIIISILLLYFFSPNIKSENIKCNILIFVFTSFIAYIILLVKLYNLVFNFIHKTRRTEIIKNELNNEFQIAFYIDYYAKRFKQEYSDLMLIKDNFKRYPNLQNLENLKELSIMRGNDSYLKDINISRLSKLSEKCQSIQKYFHPLELGKIYLKNTEIKLFSIDKKEQIPYKSVYIFSKENCLDGNYSKEYLDKLIRSVDENTLSNKFSDLKSNLRDLEEIYESYIALEK